MSGEKRAYPLGRDTDPQVPSDVHPLKLSLMKLGWQALGRMGPRRLVDIKFPRATTSYIDVARFPGVAGKVAFTIDDAFCGQLAPEKSMVDDVRVLFADHRAKATFFVTGDNCFSHLSGSIKTLLADGHELANHGMEDRPYHHEDQATFRTDLDATDTHLNRFTKKIAPYYRAPHAQFSRVMETELNRRGLRHIMVDCFANDTAIPDPKFIANFVLKYVQSGSILLIHMPERGLREWNLEAMALTLSGLKERNLEAVTVSELHRLAGLDST